jgi:hypothetical protein
MVYTVSVKWLSFKQNISDIDDMLANQQATYAILKYCTEVPEMVYFGAMDELAANIASIVDKRLFSLVEQYLLSEA